MADVGSGQQDDPDDDTRQDSDSVLSDVRVAKDGPCRALRDDERRERGVEQEEAGVAVSRSGCQLPLVVLSPDENHVNDDNDDEQPPDRGERVAEGGHDSADRQSDVAEDGERKGEVSDR
ncbi:MAG: hypothetical protein CME26_01030 [Gemmatimonadetes bacterium]|nr:hypothetical protein [Gemmatimonadota bacterium]